MRKRIAMRNLIAISVVAILGLILTIFSFNIPLSYNTFNGFLNSIPKSYDLSEGVTATYKASQTEDFKGDFDATLNDLVKKFSDIFGETHNELVVSKTESGIKVKLTNLENLYTSLENLNGAGTVEFKSEEDASATAAITGNHIKNVEYASYNGQPGVLITFTEEGGKLFYNLTSQQANAQIHIYIGGELFVSPQVSEGISGGQTFISTNSVSDAQAYAFKMAVGAKNISLEMTEIATVKASLGEHAFTYLGIVLLLVLLITFVVMWLINKQLGLIANIVIAFFATLLTLLLAILPNVQISLSGLAGILFGYLLMVGVLSLIIKNIKREFATGKKIPVSVKYAFSNSLLTVADILTPIFLISVILAWVSVGAIKSFMMPVAISCLLIALLSLVLFKLLVKIYLSVNSVKYEKFGFNKGDILSENK